MLIGVMIEVSPIVVLLLVGSVFAGAFWLALGIHAFVSRRAIVRQDGSGVDQPAAMLRGTDDNANPYKPIVITAPELKPRYSRTTTMLATATILLAMLILLLGTTAAAFMVMGS